MERMYRVPLNVGVGSNSKLDWHALHVPTSESAGLTANCVHDEEHKNGAYSDSACVLPKKP